MVYQCINMAGHDGLTDEQIQDKLRLHGNTERPRRWELSHRDGRIRKSGTRKTKSGRMAAVWVANEVPTGPIAVAAKPTWTHEYPTKDGWFWFYGSPWSEDGADQLCMVKSRRSSTCDILVCDGNFMYEGTSHGMFLETNAPTLPTKKEMS